MALIFTALGALEESLLERKDRVLERALGVEVAEEWWKDGVLVKRNATFTFYKTPTQSVRPS